MKNNRHTCVLYVTATCNLKCKYCYIDKSPILVEIDKILEDSYKDDYYYNFMTEMFDKQTLQKIEFWGGEPTYGLVRARPTIDKALQYFSNLHEFFLSTNLTLPDCVDNILNFFNFVENYPERHFTIGLQLSIDGPQKINDFNRGENVTKLFTENFSKLLFAAQEFLDIHPNVTICAHFKPTLDAYAISQLQTKESIINYFSFLEQYKLISNQYMRNPRWIFEPGIPNTATPSPHTTKDGKEFANFCHLINEIIEEQPTKKYFKYYTNVMPFIRGAGFEQYSLNEGCLTCGTGNVILGLLPQGYISGCHNGFVELISDYKLHTPEDSDYQIDKNLFKNNTNNHLIFTKKEYEVYERQMRAYCPQAVFQVTEMTAVIQQMALLKQIDEQYKDTKKAIEAAHFIQRVTSNCMRDNLGITGSKYLFALGFLRLFLNGAKEEIQYNANKYTNI